MEKEKNLIQLVKNINNKNSLQVIPKKLPNVQLNSALEWEVVENNTHSNLAKAFVENIKKLNDKIDNIQNVNQDILETTKKSQNILEEYVVPKDKKKKRALPLRSPLDQELYKKLMKMKKKKHEKSVCYSRFRVVITLLYLFGFRLNEVRTFQQEDFQNALNNRVFIVYQSKVNKFRNVPIHNKAYHILKSLEKDLEIIFFKHKFLGGHEKKNSATNFNHFINKRLKNSFDGLNIRSHSARINFITTLMRNHSVQMVAKIIGHSNLNNTQGYDRYMLTNDEIKNATSVLLD